MKTSNWTNCTLVASLSLLGASACSDAPAETVVKEIVASDKAHQLAQQQLIVDTHIDVPYRLEGLYEDVTKATEKGEFDLPRARQGGLNAAFMSIYTPPKLEDEPGQHPYSPKAMADLLIDRVEAIVGRAPNDFALAYSAKDIEDNFAAGKISLPLGMENGSPIEGDLQNLEHFYKRGVRYITLAHSESNHISDSSYSDDKHWQGLSPFGKELVTAMNDMGVMIDISHVSDQAFFQVMELTKAPVIASHSSLRHFTPGMERNMSDEMLTALKDNGGVIQINFGSFFLTNEAYQWNLTKDEKTEDFIKEHGLDKNDDKVKAFAKNYRTENPYPFATIQDVLDHIDRAVEIAGIDYVGIGSDYDGVGDSLPTGLKDVSTFPNLVEGLIQRGYSDEDIAKILGQNLMRVWQQVEEVAAKTSEQA
ncbi:dipeptidase [Thalassotalea sp. PS06]|uniref:dipeptidase n=1 Tax=Thalassotalea sp. PS06 TaxID=2594005 RepID=UPI001164993D|nr:dipeptidase [Thalassotalea sp. PS06]QDP01032.1 membrane dipeptidase [Thalassotalea sp. PS06]